MVEKPKEEKVAQKPKKPNFKHLYNYSGSLNKMQKYYRFEEVRLLPKDYEKCGLERLVIFKLHRSTSTTPSMWILATWKLPSQKSLRIG